MINLRLRRERRAEHTEPSRQKHEQPRLIFPREALDQAHRSRVGVAMETPADPIASRDEVISSIHATLDLMQRQVDSLTRDAASFRFPTRRDDDPPSTAA